MRKTVVLLIVAVTVAMSIPAFAELQNVLVGGQIRVRGNWWTSGFSLNSIDARNPLLQGPLTPSFKSVGGNPDADLRWPAQPGRLAVTSPIGFNSKNGHDWYFVEQRTKLNVRADFTEQVSAFIEFDAYTVWGANGEFRSDYLTGIDKSGVSDVSLYQAYIDVNDMFGEPLRLRIGRQELKFGSGWLVGTNDAGSFFRGLSFDGVRATYKTDQFSVDAFWSKLVETSPAEGDGDVDFSGVYASYLGVENITLDAYWLWLRDARSLTDTNMGVFGEWIEKVADVDQYHPTNLHTVGLRGAGKYAGFDFEAEVAYQFGDAYSTGQATTQGAGLSLSPYGDDNASFGKMGANLLAGYTFDLKCAPHLFAGFTYFGGEDNRGLNFGQWLDALVNPFWHAKASVSFNRLFSDWQYGQFVCAADHDCTNLWLTYLGASAKPVDNVTVTLVGAYVETVAPYRSTWPVWWVAGYRIAPLYQFSFFDKPNEKPECYEVDLSAKYQYTEDLSFEAGYSHVFELQGVRDGNFDIRNGILGVGGTAKSGADYLYFETKLSF